MTLEQTDDETALRVWNFKRLLAQKYDVVVTNPPYMGSSGMSTKLSNFVKKNYPDSKSDLSTAFMEQTIYLCNPTGFMAMINIPVWMFISSYEKLRKNIINNNRIVSMVHLGRGIFGSDFGSTTFVVCKKPVRKYVGTYLRLFAKQGDVETPDIREKAFFEHTGLNYTSQDVFLKIPGQPIAYWLKNLDIFDYPSLKKVIDARIGMVSGDNDRFLRLWFEVSNDNIEFCANPNSDPMKKTWYPLQKGGDFRKWYGNMSYVVNWANDGYEMKFDNYMGKRVRSHNYNGSQQFKDGITWNSISASKFHCRYSPIGFTYDAAGPLCEVTKDGYLWTVLGFLTTKVAEYIFSVINPTINFPSGYLESLPFKVSHKDRVDELVKICVDISKSDWDSFETSWDFKRHPMICGERTTAAAFAMWKRETEERFDTLKANEEELNRIFIDIYGLQDELTPEVEDKDVTVYRIYDSRDDIPESMSGSKYALTKQDVIKSFISYAVGCMFGRYSLDVEGLAYAGGEWDADKYKAFVPDKDNILPICDDEYFDDDIVGRFVDFVRVVYGAETLEENLKFIADALGGKGTPREVIRNYFLNDFYADHCRIYKKRPIYWLFDSGKKNGFKALIYLHRYSRDLLAKLRTDYVHEQQERYRTQLSHIVTVLNTATGSERARLLKQQDKLSEQLKEITVFEEKVHHLADMNIAIDLDDGVKKNYELFADVLAKI
jgi:hypothetical protein